MTTTTMSTSPPPPTLSTLPTEIIQQILFYLPPSSFFALSATSKTLHASTSTPLLWRHYCRTCYIYWDPRHRLALDLVKPVEDVDWRERFAARRKLDRQVDLLVERMVESARGRIEAIESVVNIQVEGLPGGGNVWDVKDALLRHVRCDEGCEDVLARRFWAKATIKRLERARAVNVWAAFGEGGDEVPSLERLVGAYDMFVDGLEDADCADVSTYIDDLAASFKTVHADYEEWTPRELAKSVARFLRAKGFKGTQDTFYHNLPNNFINRCFRDPEHPALPIICVTIYCALAQRLGLNAQPCGFPMHVYAVVSSSDTTRTLDNRAVPEPSNPDTPRTSERMYIDAFREDIEVPLSHLRAQLQSMGTLPTSALAETYLGPAPSSEIILRCSRNLVHSARMARQQTASDTADWPDNDMCMYAALWVSVLIHGAPQERGDQFEQRRNLRQFLPYVLEQMQTHFSWDVGLFESHILPLLRGLPEWGNMLEILRVVRKGDMMKRPVVRRGEHTEALEAEGGNQVVQFKVGDVFRHRRFGYMGAIIGWDVTCDASDVWKVQMNIASLERGGEQAFYHIM